MCPLAFKETVLFWFFTNPIMEITSAIARNRCRINLSARLAGRLSNNVNPKQNEQKQLDENHQVVYIGGPDGIRTRDLGLDRAAC